MLDSDLSHDNEHSIVVSPEAQNVKYQADKNTYFSGSDHFKQIWIQQEPKSFLLQEETIHEVL